MKHLGGKTVPEKMPPVRGLVAWAEDAEKKKGMVPKDGSPNEEVIQAWPGTGFTGQAKVPWTYSI
jgi:hypothetical protein